ncbi:CheR family methyltransferase [Yoonia sp. 208BN28-4]|uniref:CheR family methyltransferase n=1 Tax=Yoonia sp. 208BN28-4 TaxID=3126505 RepID=UPI003096AEE0
MSKTTNPDLPIVVGVGASAGGLEAFQLFVKGLPDVHDLVIVLVQHLDPHHESLMPELVAARTKSPVHSVQNNMTVEPGHIYLIPPGFEMEIKGTTLNLTEFDSPRGLRRPIDHFFESLAREYGEHAIAVVLSGTGSDGANGAREVKGAGGLVFVQDPAQAKYDGMPQSVLDLSGADVVSDAEEIIDVVRDYFNLRQGAHGGFDTDDEFLARVMRHVRFRTGHDFSEYKMATMQRRIAVRMSVLNISAPSDYLAYLVDTKTEADMLFRDLLINVTSFFRDEDHFETLRTEVIPELVEQTEDHGELRVWVAGCSTGEEAYSIAMLVAEEVSRVDKQCNIVVFGTDIDEQALAAARQGRYPDSSVLTIPEDFRERYFKAHQGGYEVGPRLREMVRFSRHSFIKDPPFSKLDLVSCRNVLIYLKDSLQELTSRVFHYALREGGYLFLGPSENPRALLTHFTEVSARARVFTRRPGPSRPLNLGSLSGAVLNRPMKSDKNTGSSRAHSSLDELLLEEFMPGYLHVDSDGKVLFSSPTASKYLAIRSGKVSTNIFNIVAPELETTFRRVSRLDQKVGSKAEFEYQGEIDGQPVRLIVAARRLEDGTQLFVIRDKLDLLDTRPSRSSDLSSKQDAYVSQLENELDEAKEEVRSATEELETSNEELKSSNEEMMSMNEELQSANEELTTINDELQQKLRELHQLNVDLQNFVQSARVPTVFLDEDLRLLRFTPEAEEYFSFTEADIGRKLADLNAQIDQAKLIDMCHKTVTDERERETEFQTKDDETVLELHVMPFSPDGKAQRGVVFTLQDVTDLRKAVEAAELAQVSAEIQRNEVEQIYRSSPMAMGLIATDMTYVRLNEKLAEINGVPADQHIGRTIEEIIPEVAEHTKRLVQQVLETRLPIFGERVHGSTRTDPNNRRVWESDWLPFYTDGELTGVSVNVRDVTDQVETADNLRQIMRELEHRVKNMLSNVNALINRASREATSDQHIFTTLMNRIHALSKTHALLTSEQWSSAPLRSVIEPETVDVYGADRVALSGPNIRLSAEATLAIGMAVHELATNAVKYGAFSVPEGTVSLSWSRINDAESDRLVLEWKEQGGPAVTEPQDAGFGSQLISSTLEGSLDGDVTRHWEPNGLRVVIALEFSEVTAAKSE